MSARADHLAIASRVPEGARVLDVGCGDGALLALLRDERGVDARGLELDSAEAGLALSRGLSVVQGDADTDLNIFPDDGFDVAILSKTIQETRSPAHVLAELRRIAPRILISFRNYGYWPRRFSLLTTGRMPSRRGWYHEETLHPCTCADMLDLARETGLNVAAAAQVSSGRVASFRASGFGALNWFADEVIAEFIRA
ncbi:MAG: methionine biosynthesis protein MetW [Hyphomonadaceae bacterium]|nr:methionine biosynthesis protein MetW [Hyphomonadaceae bacterium]